MFFDTPESAIAMCTVRRHPAGGFAPVLHLSSAPAPEPTATSTAQDTTRQAVDHARDLYGAVPIIVAEECLAPLAA